MSIFLHILLNNIIPIFTLISLGYALGRKFGLDISTLSKINFYIYVPLFVFVSLYTTPIPLEMLKVLVFAVGILALSLLLSKIISHWAGFDQPMMNAFTNSISFYNSGNIGVPLITLVFSSTPFVVNGSTPYLELALTTQIMVMVIQNISTNTLGFFNAGRATLHWKDSIGKILGMPTIYAMPLALLLRFVPYDMTTFPLWPAFTYAKDGLVSIALITLGVQLSRTKFDFTQKKVYLSVFTRLVGGPILALALIYTFGFTGIVAQTLMISSSVPTSVNSALIAVEYDNCPDFASQAVLISTLLSAITLTGVIYTARLLFPI
ncbi:MAG: AEC family transporter [Epulopiscium sp.]|nr:AEC family transporter [Candidatus Epulonipiscium sp.]